MSENNFIIFDPNQTEFPSEKHKEIWAVGKALIPLEVSLADIIDEETREGCMQIYNFTRELLSDMYLDPPEYTPGIWYFPTIRWFILFMNIGAEAVSGGLEWVFSRSTFEAEFEKVRNRFGDFHMYEKYGFKLLEYDDCIVITSDRYPLFLKYWHSFYKLALKRSMYQMEYLLACDFRVFAKRYTRTIEDLFRPLSDQYEAYFRELHEYVLAKGAKLESYKSYGRYRYLYNGQYIFEFTRNTCAAVPYGEKNGLSEFILEIERQPDCEELIKYVQKDICACNACRSQKDKSKKRCGYWVEIHGARRLVAGCRPNISKQKKIKRDYTDYDIKMLKRLIDIRFSQIANVVQ